MMITVTSTTKIVKIKTDGLCDGIDCRVWEGKTEAGVKVQCLILRIAAEDTEDLTQFERELSERAHPSPTVNMWPRRMVI